MTAYSHAAGHTFGKIEQHRIGTLWRWREKEMGGGRTKRGVKKKNRKYSSEIKQA